MIKGSKHSSQIPQIGNVTDTVVQAYADKLRFNLAKIEVLIVLTTPIYTTKQGLPAVVFKKEDMVKLAATCRFTLIGKFSNTMPKINLVRKSFIMQTQLCRGVKIVHFL